MRNIEELMKVQSQKLIFPTFQMIITILLVIKYKLYQSPEPEKFEQNKIAGFLWKEIIGEIGATAFYYKKIEEGKNLYLVLDSL